MDDTAALYAGALPDRARWVRSIAWQPASSDWVYWPYHNAGRVEGINGDVDFNALQGGRDRLSRLLQQQSSGPRRGDRAGFQIFEAAG